MAINAPNNPNNNSVKIPAGTYLARCIQMIEIGTVPETFKGTGVTKMLKKCRIVWEIYDDELVSEDGKVPTIGADYTLSMYEKANLRKMVESWRGKSLTEEESLLFDVTILVGATCQLTIKDKTVNEKTYMEIAGVTKLMKNVKCPNAVNELEVISYDNFDVKKFEKLPNWIKVKMEKSLEYKALNTAKNNNHAHNASSGTQEEEEDDLPF
jgi:hypothetical protein